MPFSILRALPALLLLFSALGCDLDPAPIDENPSVLGDALVATALSDRQTRTVEVPLYAPAYAAPATPVPDEGVRYFLIVYAYENVRNAPRMSHTFAEFFKVWPNGVVEKFAINWLPEAYEIHNARGAMPFVGVHDGHNADVVQTLAEAARHDRRFTRRFFVDHGPFEIRPELYVLAAKRKAMLESGARYSFLSAIFKGRRDSAPMCILALDIFGNLNSGFDRGAAAARDVVDAYARKGYIVATPTRVPAGVVSALAAPAPLLAAPPARMTEGAPPPTRRRLLPGRH